ncbi:Shedu immune nuclease family protein [Micavibrio aeruginosavorus]|uniref:Shedu protein SduA C-terminal domain-containing protein n=1 Tax=Micavibrio aeruginosavorus EPB TaxID=349215 RepID=M4VF17_9BACT|nr:Shedu immune nuclease family protein [Micavibrio aeruginosavorus]AGH97070.1 hypothetical protein A11S_234 [Micavibrio aeruginosavorus EPB]
MIKIRKKKNSLLLEYSGDESSWVYEKITNESKVTIRKIFTFKNQDLLAENKPSDGSEHENYNNISFALGKMEGDYYKIEARILGLKHDLFLATDMRIDHKIFIAHRDISIFSRIDELISEPIVIGGNRQGAIPIEAFETLLLKFPNSTEVTHYARSRISMILEDYFETMTDAQEKLKKHLQKKPLSYSLERSLISNIYEYEIQKYEYIRDRIEEELGRKSTYSEDNWRDLMLHFILLIFPKYVAVLRNLHLKDFYSKKDKTTNRYADIALVDVNGNIDIIEIKQPFDNCLISNKAYRDNFLPKKELAGAIMQAEKYIFHLNKWGIDGEREITKKHANILPHGIELKITNPKALIILGRTKGLTAKQTFDLELIRRKYSNIMDIITYDDLLCRLNNIIEKLKNSP